MNALLNAHTKRGCDSPPHIGFASNVSPEAQSSQTGVSSEYVQQEGYNWFVLRATYNRVNAAVEKAKKNDIKTYVPMHYVPKSDCWEEEANTTASSSQLSFYIRHKGTIRQFCEKDS